MKTRLQKFKVCAECLSVNTNDINCVCAFGDPEIIELEFEVCDCCGQVINDGNPADTPFNTQQLKNRH